MLSPAETLELYSTRMNEQLDYFALDKEKSTLVTFGTPCTSHQRLNAFGQRVPPFHNRLDFSSAVHYWCSRWEGCLKFHLVT